MCEFRARLIAGSVEQTLLDAMLALPRAWAVEGHREGVRLRRSRWQSHRRGRQHTDSTHVLAAMRAVNRLESVGETLRAALNALAAAAPDWLMRHADAEWPDCYGRAFEEWRLPKGEAPRKALGEVIGADGHRLLAAAYDPPAPPWLRDLPAVQTLRRAWVSQFYVEADRVTWRDRADLPPASLRFGSPYDPDARFGNKRSTTWSGYKAHKHRNLLGHAPDTLREEITADYTDMIPADTPKAVQERRRAFLRKWRLRCPAVATSLEGAAAERMHGGCLFAFLRLPPSQWKSARTTNAIERLHEEFKRRIKPQAVLPSAETAVMLFWALLASGQITMRKVDGWQTLGERLSDPVPVDLAA